MKYYWILNYDQKQYTMNICMFQDIFNYIQDFGTMNCFMNAEKNENE